MKNKILTFLMGMCVFLNGKPQPFNPDLNSEINKNDSRLHEEPTGHFTADQVLNGKIKWQIPVKYELKYDDSGFDYSRIGKVPPKGVFPRIFTSPAEFGKIRHRLENTDIGKSMLSLAKESTEEMRNGKGRFGAYYQSLLLNEIAPDSAKTAGNKFANSLAVQGLLAHLENDNVLLKETAKVAANFLRSMSKYADRMPVIYGHDDYAKEVIYNGGYQARLFDFTATGMDAADKKFYLDYLTKNTYGKYGPGMELPHHWRMWNHIAMDIAYPLTVLIAENQPNYDKRIYERGKELVEDYITYTYSPEGMSTEGMTYTFNAVPMDMSFMAAILQRGGKNLFANPHFRAIADWLIYTLAPNPEALWSSHGDTGSKSAPPWAMMMMMKYFFPKDAKIDYIFSHSLPKQINEVPDVTAYIFCADPDKTVAEYNAIPPVDIPLTYFAEKRGSLITRDRWDKKGIMLQFEARRDTYFPSHDHSDRGHFELASHGREWIVDGWRSTETKYHSVVDIDGRGQGYFPTPGNWLNYADNKDATFGVVDLKYCYDWMWLKSPVADMMLGKEVSPKWREGVYRNAADRLMVYYEGKKPERDPLNHVADYYSGNLQGNPLIWKEDTWPMRLEHNPVEYAYRTTGLVRGKHPYILIVDDIRKDGNERLYEWLAPMPLDVEPVSIKQLAGVKQLSGALDIGFNRLSDFRKYGEYDIILGDKRMHRDMRDVDNVVGSDFNAGKFKPSNGDPQLLVRVLDKSPAHMPALEPNPRLETIEKLKTNDMHQFYLRSMGLGKRLVIPSRSKDGNFKVLLFPHLHGEELPHTEWNDERTELIVSWKEQTDKIFFEKMQDGQTVVRIERNGKEIINLK